MQPIIRVLTKADYESFEALYFQGDFHHHQSLRHIFRAPTRLCRTMEYFEKLLSDPDTLVVGAELDGSIVGLGQVTLKSDAETPVRYGERYAYIDSVVIGEKYRGKGIGTAIVHVLQDWARDKGVTRVHLHVWSFNKGAASLYRKLGYQSEIERMVLTLE